MERIEVSVQRDRCPYCHDAVGPHDPKLACDACMAWHHAECWDEQDGCGACGGAMAAGHSRPRAAIGAAARVRPPCDLDGCVEPIEPPLLREVPRCRRHAFLQAGRWAAASCLLGLPMSAVGVGAILDGQLGPGLAVLGPGLVSFAIALAYAVRMRRLSPKRPR